MEDVISAGTSNRPAKNISEVSIQIQNPDKDGPMQYNELDEITVTRRIERDKGSKYFINKKEVKNIAGLNINELGYGRTVRLIEAPPSI